jgi:hypothetical protein
MYITYLDILFNNSMSLVNLFTDVGIDSQYGSWGLFEYVDSRWNISLKWLGVAGYFSQQAIAFTNLTLAQCMNNCTGNGICHYGQCFCYSDYQGANCDTPRFTDFIECGYLCSSNGICGLSSIIGNNRYFNCTCNAGYIGAYCGIAICTGDCNYQGTCTAA